MTDDQDKRAQQSPDGDETQIFTPEGDDEHTLIPPTDDLAAAADSPADAAERTPADAPAGSPAAAGSSADAAVGSSAAAGEGGSADSAATVADGDAGAGLGPVGDPDRTQMISPAGVGPETVIIPTPPPVKPGLDQTRVMPASAAGDPNVWKGRAEVPQPSMRDAVPAESYEAVESGRTWWTPLLLGVLALVLVGLIAVGLWLALRDRNPSPVTTTQPPTAAPVTSAAVQPSTAGPTVQLVKVPPLLGRDGEDAADELDRLGFEVDLVPTTSLDPEGTVVRQDPIADSMVPFGSLIKLYVAIPPSPPPPSPTPEESPSPSPEVTPT